MIMIIVMIVLLIIMIIMIGVRRRHERGPLGVRDRGDVALDGAPGEGGGEGYTS